MDKKRLSVAFGLLSMLAIGTTAQEGPFRIDTELVSVNVAVKDAKGRPVKGLAISQFQILDNGVPQKIEHFAQVDSGVTFGIVYDMHPTTVEHTRAVLEGLRQFTRGLSVKDDFFLVAFNERGSLAADVVPDAEQLDRHLSNPANREPRSLYDALLFAIEKLRSRKNIKRTLLVITDTADHNSRCSFNELRGELRKSDMRVYAIVPDRDLERSYAIDLNPDAEARLWSDANSTERSAINSITLRSGGSTFPASLRRQGNIVRILAQISTEMHDQYTIAFYPSTAMDGKWHELKVRLDAGRIGNDFVLTYRPGYQSNMPRN